MVSTMEASIGETIGLVDSLLENRGSFGGLTGAGSIGARIPGTRWADMNAQLNTLKARSAFGSLQEMRANSPTGGALGAVSERELDLLMNAETQLTQNQSPEAFERALRNYKRVLEGSRRRLREGFNEHYQDMPQAAPGDAPARPWSAVGAPTAAPAGGVDDLLGKYGAR